MLRRVLIFFALCSCAILHAQNINLVFSGFKSPKGQVILKIFKDDQSFQDDKPATVLKFKKENVVNGAMLLKINLEDGVYGLAFIDDEDNSGNMNYSFIGMPKEGFGFSNYYLTGLSKPKFDAFKIKANKAQVQNVLMRVKYL